MSENDDLLATLRRRDTEASPGPWFVHSVPARTARLLDADDRYIANFAPTGSWKRRQFNARLAALAHEVLPLVEALVDDGHTAEDNAWCRLTRIGNMLTALTCGKCQLLARLRERVAALGATP